ncbi:MAG TPA: L-arabinose isomerase [Verrucomicrobiae bacterium]|nr:L-arabinose isomerase [Verrucomicrobiae bacterium]
MKINLKQFEVWFVTGSQHLYGPETLKAVAKHSQEIAKTLNAASAIPVKVVFKPVMVSPDAITELCQQANNAAKCIGLVTWCHTFSPSKMWINGLKQLRKPICHLHTQYNRDLPWASIDMDFMNMNQAAHGDREHGFIMSRMRLNRKVVVGFWQEAATQEKIGAWARAAAAWADWQGAKFVRFGDNMREVAVTEGDKVSAQLKFGFSVNTHGVGDLVKVVNAVSEKEVDALCKSYETVYEMTADLKKGGKRHKSIREAARIELGILEFLAAGGFKGYTDTFEDLHGLAQLPGVGSQRMMAAGFGFGGEGDWKTSALVRAMKVMASGLEGGTSFMEDYTYHLQPGNKLVLGAHMLEICPSIADGKVSLQVHPLGIGGKADPARLVFNTPPGAAVNASLMDFGNRFRLLINEVDCVTPDHAMPRLPVAQAMWKCRPSFEDACAAWIYAGGAHHTGFSQAVTTEMLEDFGAIAGLEVVVIDADTKLRQFKQELAWNDAAYGLKSGWVA